MLIDWLNMEGAAYVGKGRSQFGERSYDTRLLGDTHTPPHTPFKCLIFVECKIEWQTIIYEAQKQNNNAIWDMGREKEKSQKGSLNKYYLYQLFKKEGEITVMRNMKKGLESK